VLPLRTTTAQSASITAALALSLTGCGASVRASDEARVEYAGRIGATELAVGVARDGARVVAYVCGGSSTIESHTAWYEGAVDESSRDARATLTGPRGTLSLAFEGAAVSGSLVDAAGVSRSFRVARAEPEALGGLYEHRGAQCRTGVIVYEGAGGSTLAQGAGCDASGRRSQVTPIRPMSLDARGLAVSLVDDPRSVVLVRPVRPSGSTR
jgi:hypothetical protein